MKKKLRLLFCCACLLIISLPSLGEEPVPKEGHSVLEPSFIDFIWRGKPKPPRYMRRNPALDKRRQEVTERFYSNAAKRAGRDMTQRNLRIRRHLKPPPIKVQWDHSTIHATPKGVPIMASKSIEISIVITPTGHRVFDCTPSGEEMPCKKRSEYLNALDEAGTPYDVHSLPFQFNVPSAVNVLSDVKGETVKAETKASVP